MSDIFDSHKRKSIMSHISGRNTKPELLVRKILFSLGYRYRLYEKSLPGCPDIVFKSRKKAIFIHGCFWHGHENCKRAKRPSTNVDFWNEKIDKNILRDVEVRKELERLGWKVLIVWQCELKHHDDLKIRLTEFLGDRGKNIERT